MGPTALLPLQRKARCGFLWPLNLKIHRMGQVLNLQTLSPMESTITITPPTPHSLLTVYSKQAGEYNLNRRGSEVGSKTLSS
jgi:hypothetical protein